MKQNSNDGLKGQKHIAQGNALGTKRNSNYAL